jgi:hypothetical protein
VITAGATVRRKPSVDGGWRRLGRAVVDTLRQLGRGVIYTVIALLAMSSVLALFGAALYVAAHPDILQQLLIHLRVWWHWLAMAA